MGLAPIQVENSRSTRAEKAFFERYQGQYFHRRYPRSLFLKATRSLSQMTRLSGARVLDAGCGQGQWGSYFSGRGASVIGIDISHEAITAAKRLNGIDAVCADARFLPFKTGTFDLVFCGGVLHHLRPETILLSSRDIYRVMKEQGKIFTLDPSARCPYTNLMYNRTLFRFLKKLYGFGDLSPDENPIWPHVLREIIEESGFRAIALTFAQVLPSTITDGDSFVSALFSQLNSYLERTLIGRAGSIVFMNAIK